MGFEAISPHDGSLLSSYPYLNEAEVDGILDRSIQAHLVSRTLDFEILAQRFLKLSNLLTKGRSILGGIIHKEMGKSLAEAKAEVVKCAWVCRYYAEKGGAFLDPEDVDITGGHAQIHYRPLGTIVMIMPWNFPFWQVFRCAIPILASGNSVILKHAENVPECALAITDLFQQSGFGDAFQNAFVDHEGCGLMIDDARVHGVTLTGSTRAGRTVYQRAAGLIKPVVLELGGSDPFIVLADANVKKAAEVGARARLMNTGQSCIAAKRFIVDRSVKDEFLEELQSRFESTSWGDAEAAMGPMVSPGVNEGTHCMTRSVRSVDERSTPGFLEDSIAEPMVVVLIILPTILDDVLPGQPAFDEELFGPVAAIVTVDGARRGIKDGQ